MIGGFNMYRKKTVVIMIMCIATAFMAVGYALISTRLNINGSTVVTSSWRVEFSDIRTTNLKGGATNIVAPTYSATTATFNVDLVQPGDEVTYEIDITNYGDIKAQIKGANYLIEGSDAIYVTIEGIRKGTIIEGCETQSSCPYITAIIKVGYDPSVEKDPEEKTKSINITLDIGQYIDGSPVVDGELIPELQRDTLVQQILNDNIVDSDGSIDFLELNETGLFYTNQNTENNQTTYYFRGAVGNNYVSFADHLWRIVRINEDGSVRLITDYSVGQSPFNDQGEDNAYVGYMYGTPGSDNYADTHANINDSTVKEFLDEWYDDNLSDYSVYLADAGFCNDRSIAQKPNMWGIDDTALGYGDNGTSYGVSQRLDAFNYANPIFKCPQNDDLFTLTTSNKGNRALNRPIGLISLDEVIYAGGAIEMSTDNYLTNGDYWFMFGSRYTGSIYAMWDFIDSESIDDPFDVRPVINLKSNVEIISGNGDEETPYVIKTN